MDDAFKCFSMMLLLFVLVGCSSETNPSVEQPHGQTPVQADGKKRPPLLEYGDLIKEHGGKLLLIGSDVLLDFKYVTKADAVLEQLNDQQLLQKYDGMSLDPLRLDLSHTDLTDAGLEHLMRLTNLKRLHLTGTKVTEDGLNNLKAALPECELIKHPF